MKANELMIGDWVKPSCWNEQVLLVGEGRVTVKSDSYTEDEIKPIPLTGEILEKNGFKVGHYLVGLAELPEYKMVNRKDLKDIEKNVITIRQSSNVLFDMQVGIGSHIFDITYVHELQHALRLCGIEKEIEL